MWKQTEVDDIGKYLAQAGMTANRAGPSTMGTLFSTALMRAGKAVRSKTDVRRRPGADVPGGG